MNQYLFDDDYLMWIFPEDDEEQYSTKKTLFSRFEKYFLFQGLTRNRSSTDYLNFVKLYLRAETKKTEVKRRYQKVNEFYADASSLLITAYEIVIIIFEFLNTFWAEQSLSKKIFFFQDFDKKLNINDKEEKIRELLYITEPKINDKNNSKSLQKNYGEEKPVKIINTIENFKNEKILYTSEKGRYSTKNVDILTPSEQTVDDFNFNNEKISNSYRGWEYYIGDDNINSKNQIRNCKNNFSYETTDNNIYNISHNKYQETSASDIDEKKEEKIEFKYHLYDKIKDFICKCCLSKKNKIKNELYEKSKELLDKKLDIVLYVRNTILLDIINEILLDSETRHIVNVLTRPIISSKRKEDIETSLYYDKFKESDFDNFYKELINLCNKKDKKNDEIKLVSICNKHLKNMIIWVNSPNI